MINCIFRMEDIANDFDVNDLCDIIIKKKEKYKQGL